MTAATLLLTRDSPERLPEAWLVRSNAAALLAKGAYGGRVLPLCLGLHAVVLIFSRAGATVLTLRIAFQNPPGACAPSSDDRSMTLPSQGYSMKPHRRPSDSEPADLRDLISIRGGQTCPGAMSDVTRATSFAQMPLSKARALISTLPRRRSHQAGFRT